jgi:alpha-L-fucosidase
MEYQPTRESVDRHVVPEWYHDAKFGIFIHWSLSCVPAFAPADQGDIMQILRNGGPRVMFANQPYSEWYLNSLRIKGSPAYEYHRKTYGADFDYYRFAEDFNRALGAWQPAAWADLFQQVGARYVVLVAKHHDGFLLWPSEHPNPGRPGLHASRNVVKELTDEVKARGMRMGFYYSSPYDWTFTEKPITDLAMSLARAPTSGEYLRYATSHWYELIDTYRPSVLWNDIGYPSGVNVNEIFAHFYNKTPDGVVNERWGQASRLLGALVHVPGVRQAIDWYAARLWLQGHTSPNGVHHDFVTPEYTSFADVREEKWECVRGIGKSFGYNKQEKPDDFLSVRDLVRLLADIVSKNGNLLLNVGPKPGGEIPEVQLDRIKGVGAWLAVNGDAIYGTRPWTTAEGRTTDGGEVRFTSKPDSLFAILMQTPAGQEVTIESLKAVDGMRVELLGCDRPLEWQRAGAGLTVRFGRRLPDSPAVCLKMTPPAQQDDSAIRRSTRHPISREAD